MGHQNSEPMRYLRKYGDTYNYPWTEALSLRKDMYEIDDPFAPPKTQSGVLIDEREAHVMGLVTKAELQAYAEENGIEIPSGATTVRKMQAAIRMAILSGDLDEETPKAKTKAKKAKAPAADDTDGTDGTDGDPV